MRQSPVPESFDEFYARYARFVSWAIRTVSRGQLTGPDLEDLQQLVFLRVWEKDYLTRCRQLIAERGTGEFSTYLYWLVRSVCVNQFAKNKRTPTNLAHRLVDPGSTDVGGDGRPLLDVVQRGHISPSQLVDTAFEDRLAQTDALARFARYVEQSRRGAQLARTLQLMAEGHTTPDIMRELRVSKGTIVRARQDLRTARAAFLQRVG